MGVQNFVMCLYRIIKTVCGGVQVLKTNAHIFLEVSQPPLMQILVTDSFEWEI